MPKMTATINETRDEATIEFFEESGLTGSLKVAQADLLRLIQTLGKVHAHMSEGQEIPPLEGQQIEGIFNTRWYVNPEMMGEATAMAFYHPAYGPLGFLVPIDQIPLMIQLLTSQVTLSEQLKQELKN